MNEKCKGCVYLVGRYCTLPSGNNCIRDASDYYTTPVGCEKHTEIKIADGCKTNINRGGSMSAPKTLKVDDVEYVRKSDVESSKMAATDGKKYVVIRTYSAGVHVGYLESHDGKEVKLLQSRRIWKWSGACSLSQIAMEGVKKPEDCNFSMPVSEIILTEAIEIIPCTEIAMKNIQGVPEWKQ